MPGVKIVTLLILLTNIYKNLSGMNQAIGTLFVQCATQGSTTDTVCSTPGPQYVAPQGSTTGGHASM